VQLFDQGFAYAELGTHLPIQVALGSRPFSHWPQSYHQEPSGLGAANNTFVHITAVLGPIAHQSPGLSSERTELVLSDNPIQNENNRRY
jgi:hypothetical protein